MSAYLFPGQGSQKKGMGAALFDAFPELVQQADDILGYSIKSLCLDDALNQLSHTQFTQPALYVVNALAYLHRLVQTNQRPPDFLLGHSLGEYNALWAAGVFDFSTGLRLVQKRALLMEEAPIGAMAAIIGLDSAQVADVLQRHALHDLSIANYNSYLQHVLSGPKTMIEQAQSFFMQSGAQYYIPLSVNGAFHSGMMTAARVAFTDFLAHFSFSSPNTPVIANLNALPYCPEHIKTTLALQIDHSVQWVGSIQYLIAQGETCFEEVGPGNVLNNIVRRIMKNQ